MHVIGQSVCEIYLKLEYIPQWYFFVLSSWHTQWYHVSG